MRIVGRRTASQLAPVDLVVLFLFAGATITAVLGDDRSFTGAMSAVFSIGLMRLLASWLKTRSDFLGRLIDGTPVVIVENGALNEARLRRLRMTPQDVMSAARQRGIMRLAQILYAMAERDGKISIVDREET